MGTELRARARAGGYRARSIGQGQAGIELGV